MSTHYVRVLLAAGAFIAGLIQPALSQTYPTKPIRLIVPYAPGGGTDLIGRLLSQKIEIGQPMIVDNRAGANGTIGFEAISRAAPDGYVIGFATPTLTVNPLLMKSYTVDAVKDFTHITLLTEGPSLLVVNPDVPAKSVGELILYAKANPGKLNIGIQGGPFNLDVAAMVQAMGVQMYMIPYNGSAVAVPALLGNQIQVLLDPVISVKAHIESGKLRALAVGSSNRYGGMPNLPTLAESGLPGFKASAVWFGILGPAKLPSAVVARLNPAFNKAVLLPEIKAKLSDFGQEPIGTTPEQFRDYVSRDVSYFTKAAQVAGVKPE